jgi:hypothetical protein
MRATAEMDSGGKKSPDTFWWPEMTRFVLIVH